MIRAGRLQISKLGSNNPVALPKKSVLMNKFWIEIPHSYNFNLPYEDTK